jgi:hypothetical protein
MKELRYPKTYATITRVEARSDDTLLYVRTVHGRDLQTSMRQRNGRGHTAESIPGTRIKLYIRNNQYYFRKVGS